MKKTKRIILLAVGLFFLFTASGFPEIIQEQRKDVYTEPNTYLWEFDTSLSYSTGDFGTPTTTNTLYWPLTIRRFFKDADIAFTFPFIYQKSGPGIAAISGHPFQISNNTNGREETHGGIGDLLLNGRYYVFNESTQAFTLSTIGQIKFPTANDNDGLGTGEFDETIGLESSKNFDQLWSGYLNLYYTFIGEPPGRELDNEFTFSIGVGYQIRPSTQATLFYRESTALVDDQDNPRTVSLGLNHKLTNETMIYGSTGFGVSEGSPDVILSLGASYLF